MAKEEGVYVTYKAFDKDLFSTFALRKIKK